MKRLLIIALLSSAGASPSFAQAIQRAQNGYIAGPIVNCVSVDGSSGARCVLNGSTLYDTSGNALGTSSSSFYTIGKGGNNLATGQVSVGTTSTLVAAARPGRQSVTVDVTTAVQCAYGNSGVTLSTGFPLAAVAYASQKIDTSAAVYAVCASAATVGYMEQY